MKRILLTGGGRGLGHHTAVTLAALGHDVLFTARTPQAIDATVAAARSRSPTAKLEGRLLELGSFAAVRAFAQQLREERRAIEVLFHCAGVLQQSAERRLTSDGLEETLAVNALAPFLLTHELWPLLGRGARVVNVASRLHLPDSRGEPVHFDFDDVQLTSGYHPERAYKNSKLALLWFTHELARRAAGGVSVNAVCPGFVPVTAAEVTHGAMKWVMRHVMPHMPFATSVEAAVDSFVFMALDPSLDAATCGFYGEKHQLEPSAESRDVSRAARFWNEAARLTGVSPDWPSR